MYFLNCNQHFADFKQQSFWLLFDKIASACIIWKTYPYFSIETGQPR